MVVARETAVGDDPNCKVTAEPLALEYAELKAAAAAEHAHDREAYAEAKAAFVRRVLDQRS